MSAPLWITYAWVDNEEGDFDYLVGALAKKGVVAKYDRIALVARQRLWEQIGNEITRSPLAGWAYLLTPGSLSSEACQEELAYALDRALASRRTKFPLIGLLSEVAIADVPPPLRVRLCIDLRSPDWDEQIRAALENRPLARTVAPTPNVKGRLHNGYLGKPEHKAVEILPRFGEICYWRIAFPSAGPQPIIRGVGPAGGGGTGFMLQSVVEGTVDINGQSMNFFGAGDAISPSTAGVRCVQGCVPARSGFRMGGHTIRLAGRMVATEDSVMKTRIQVFRLNLLCKERFS